MCHDHLAAALEAEGTAEDAESEEADLEVGVDDARRERLAYVPPT